MTSDLASAARTIAEWAADQPEVGEVWLFGSRVRGEVNVESDLDVGIILRDPSRQPDQRLAVWIFQHRVWHGQLQTILGAKLDLQLGDVDLSDEIVGPAIATHGIQIYRSE